jgi:restriction endonuclease S subunit
MRYKFINIQKIQNQQKIKGSYFLSDGVLKEERIKSMPNDFLIDTVDYCSNIGGINKRIYVDETNGIPLVSMTEMLTHNPQKNCKYVSKIIGIHTFKHLFKEQMIVASVVGAIGELAYVNKLSSGSVTGNNIIKFLSNKEGYNGYLYAYLCGSYGNQILKKLKGGAVQSYVDPELFKKIPVPRLSAEIRLRTHNLIESASRLRVEANNLLDKSVELIELEMGSFEGVPKNERMVPSNLIFSNYNKRFNSTSYLNFGQDSIKLLKESKVQTSRISELGFQVTRPGIFKRVKVKQGQGFPYIKGAELAKLNPFSSCEYLSKTKTPFLDELRLKENQILLTCAGTVGETRLITKEFEENNAVGSQDIIRIDAKKSEISQLYLFAYLKTKLAHSYIQSLKYGAVIERVEPFHIESLPVFITNNRTYELIIENIKNYSNNLYLAFCKEKLAIETVEKEIEEWQK